MARNRWFRVFCRLFFCTVHYLRMSRRCRLVWVRELKMRSSNWCVSLFLSHLCFTPNWPLFLPYPAYPSLLIICDFLCPSLPPSLSFSPALSLSSVRADHVTLTVNFALFVGETQVSVSSLLSYDVCFSLLVLLCFIQGCRVNSFV